MKIFDGQLFAMMIGRKGEKDIFRVSWELPNLLDKLYTCVLICGI